MVIVTFFLFAMSMKNDSILSAGLIDCFFLCDKQQIRIKREVIIRLLHRMHTEKAFNRFKIHENALLHPAALTTILKM